MPRLLLLSLFLLLGLPLLAQAPADFILRDFLGRTWRNELVTYPLSGAQAVVARGNKALVGLDGKAIPYQLLNLPDGKAGIAFLTDLDPFATRAYKFTNDDAGVMATDLKVEETADTISLSNGKTGIMLRKALAVGAGPIAGVKLASGKWVGDSRLAADPAVGAYTVAVTAKGPVYAEAVCTAAIGDGTWELRVRLQANEPVVLLDERSAVDAKSATFSVDMSKNLQPDSLLYRYGKQVPEAGLNKNGIYALQPGEVFVLEPWLHWAERTRQGSCFSLYRNDGTDLLTLAGREAGVWVDPKIPWEKQADVRVWVKQDDAGVHIDFPLKTGQRKWMLAALDKDASLVEAKDEKKIYDSPLPYRYLVKHGQFPLNMVKDYTLTWQTGPVSYPHMLVIAADVDRFKKSVADPKPYQDAIPRYIGDPNPLGQWNSEGPITAYFATRDPKLGRYLSEGALKAMQGSVDCFLKQDGGVPPLGSAPHHFQYLGVCMLLADVALATGQLTPAEQERLLAQVAFIGYTEERPDYWAPERGFGGTANMSTSVYGYQTAAACLIPSHPRASGWVKASMEQLKAQIEGWSDDKGGWLESPHYAMVSVDQILSAFVMTHNAGLNDYIFLPKVKLVMNWFSQISCPPDSRLGARHLVAAGHTYQNEATGEFGILASLYKQKDPAFSAQMQWMFREHRSWPEPGTGGGYPGFAGFRSLLRDPNLPAAPPPWTSEWFPQTGVVLRSGFPSPQETMLYMIAGNHRDHMDDDSGSFILYGKGRIVADDFGYYNPSITDHNMIESLSASGIMSVKEFSPSKTLDYVRGEKQAWTRQIAFVKDPDPMGPNYFVVCDGFPAPSKANWRLHVTANAVKVEPQWAKVEGKEDVDTDVYFLRPEPVTITTEQKTRRSNSGIYPDGRTGPMDITQTAIVATAWARDYTTIIYPRHKLQSPLKCTPIADGKGAKIEHDYGTDYVFLARAPFEYEDEDIRFKGQVGCIQIRKGKATLSLGAGGMIAYKSQMLKSPKPLPVVTESNNQIWDGDFESGVQRFFVADSQQYGVRATLFTGNPVKGDATHAGTYCAALEKYGDRGVTWTNQRLAIDPTKTYRISVTAMTAETMNADFYSYGNAADGRQLPNWQWDVYYTGPTATWKTVETTIGPKGSGAKVIWPPDIASIGFGVSLSGKGTIYVDDITLEPLDQ